MLHVHLGHAIVWYKVCTNLLILINFILEPKAVRVNHNRYVELEVLPNNECKLRSKDYTLLCTSGKDKVGVCKGDSGGPLSVNICGQDILVSRYTYRQTQIFKNLCRNWYVRHIQNFGILLEKLIPTYWPVFGWDWTLGCYKYQIGLFFKNFRIYYLHETITNSTA